MNKEPEKKTNTDTDVIDLSETEEDEIIDVDLSDLLERWGFCIGLKESEDTDPAN